jgi:serine/threonine protein kinase
MSKWTEHCEFCHDQEYGIKLLKNFQEVFELVESLGDGSYGEVYLVRTLCDAEPHYYALKVLKNPNEDEIINRETVNLEQISKFPHCHPSFVCFYDVFCFYLDVSDGKTTKKVNDKSLSLNLKNKSLGKNFPNKTSPGRIFSSNSTSPKNSSSASSSNRSSDEDSSDEDSDDSSLEVKYVGILTEFIDGYDLYDYTRNLMKLGKEVNPDFIATIGEWLLHSVQILHEKDIIHRDIKPENIMITKNYRPKLLDFGLACQSEEEIDFKTHKIICDGNKGTKGFAAPEIYDGSYKKNKRKYCRTADAFSIGATLYFLLARRMPYVMLPDKWIYLPLDYKIPSEITYVVERLLELNPDKRMGIHEAYRALHKYNLAQHNKRQSK